MDSILDLDTTEIKSIKKILKSEDGLQDQLQEYGPQLFETCFLMLLSTGAKTENFPLLKELEDS